MACPGLRPAVRALRSASRCPRCGQQLRIAIHTVHSIASRCARVGARNRAAERRSMGVSMGYVNDRFPDDLGRRSHRPAVSTGRPVVDATAVRDARSRPADRARRRRCRHVGVRRRQLGALGGRQARQRSSARTSTALERAGLDNEGELRPTIAELRLLDMDSDNIEATVMYGPVAALDIDDPGCASPCTPPTTTGSDRVLRRGSRSG